LIVDLVFAFTCVSALQGYQLLPIDVVLGVQIARRITLKGIFHLLNRSSRFPFLHHLFAQLRQLFLGLNLLLVLMVDL
jgi:hypothetical protein